MSAALKDRVAEWKARRAPTRDSVAQWTRRLTEEDRRKRQEAHRVAVLTAVYLTLTPAVRDVVALATVITEASYDQTIPEEAVDAWTLECERDYEELQRLEEEETAGTDPKADAMHAALVDGHTYVIEGYAPRPRPKRYKKTRQTRWLRCRESGCHRQEPAHGNAKYCSVHRTPAAKQARHRRRKRGT